MRPGAFVGPICSKLPKLGSYLYVMNFVYYLIIDFKINIFQYNIVVLHCVLLFNTGFSIFFFNKLGQTRRMRAVKYNLFVANIILDDSYCMCMFSL